MSTRDWIIEVTAFDTWVQWGEDAYASPRTARSAVVAAWAVPGHDYRARNKTTGKIVVFRFSAEDRNLRQ